MAKKASEQELLAMSKKDEENWQERKVYKPTPEEIALACEEIRKGWTWYEQARRRGGIVTDNKTKREYMEDTGFDDYYTVPVMRLNLGN